MDRELGGPACWSPSRVWCGLGRGSCCQPGQPFPTVFTWPSSSGDHSFLQDPFLQLWLFPASPLGSFWAGPGLAVATSCCRPLGASLPLYLCSEVLLHKPFTLPFESVPSVPCWEAPGQ